MQRKACFLFVLGCVNLEGARFTKCFDRIREVFVSSVVPLLTLTAYEGRNIDEVLEGSVFTPLHKQDDLKLGLKLSMLC